MLLKPAAQPFQPPIVSIDGLVRKVQTYNAGAPVDVLRRAWTLSNSAHHGQTRQSGEPFVVHPLAVANILTDLRMDVPSIAAGLLHDTLEDTLIPREQIEREFGPDVMRLVDGVTKIGKIQFKSYEEKQAENFRKMILSMAEDIRVILIKLADRLHNMRTLHYLPEERRTKIAQETLDIYAPIANRLGMSKVKNELEELAFKSLEPKAYEALQRKVEAKRKAAESTIGDLTKTIRAKLEEAQVPVIAISAIRTGCGKSQTARWLGRRLRERGKRVAVLRHPMPYGDLERQRVQRFAQREDLDAAGCTAEEREEYEPHLAAGHVVFAGVDYAAIVERAEREADLIVWDGGNNDFPLLRPDLHIVMADALRPGQAAGYHPGEAVLRMADVVVVNKVDAAPAGNVRAVIDEVRAVNPGATIVRAASPVRLDDPAAARGRRVLVVEDGPTLTHGGMAYGAGYVAATAGGAAAIVDPRASATPGVRAIFDRYPHIGPVLPAVGYDAGQLQELRETINRASADVVVAATPLDLAALIALEKPVVRARYDFEDAGAPTLGSLVDAFLARDRKDWHNEPGAREKR